MFAKPNLFFIDLEQTIIESWQAPDLINVQRIRSWLEVEKADEIRIFSFAIWNEIDKQRFNDEIKTRIEDALGLPVMSWPSVQDMMKADFRHTGIRFETGHEVSEFIQLRGKKDAFMHFVFDQYDFHRAVLIDDVVPDLTVAHRKKGWSVELWNVDSL